MKYLFTCLSVLLYVKLSMAQWQTTNYSEDTQIQDIHFISEDVGYVVGYHELHKTSDGGNTWSLVVAQPFTNGPTLVHFFNENVGLIAGTTGGGAESIQIAKTINGGNSWTTSSFEDGGGIPSPKDFFFLDDNNGFMIDKSGVILKTTNQGNTWTEIYETGSDEPKAIHFTSPSVGYLTLTYDTKILKTINGGNSWSEIDLGYAFSGNDIYFTDEQTGFIASNSSRILRTTDAGLTWTVTDFGSSDDLYALAFTNHLTGYAVGQNGTLITTSNGGDSWTPSLSGSSDLLNCIDFVNDSVGYIGTYDFPSHVLRTSNGGGILNIGEQESNSDFDLFPTENGSVYAITCSNHEPYTLSVVDLKGSIIFASKKNSGTQEINLSGAKPGMYLVHITQAGTSQTVKLVKH